MSVRITNNHPKLLGKLQRNSGVALRRAADDVLRVSRPKTPLGDSTFLRNNTVIQVLGNKATITWNTVYAQYQERGSRRDGSHRVRRYSTGGTGKNFAENAIVQVTKNASKYIKGALK